MNRFSFILLVVVLPLLLNGCPAGDRPPPSPLRHPADAGLGQTPPQCSDCHDSASGFPYASYNHGRSFASDHRLAAQTAPQVCQLCHAPSYCGDCHALRSDLTPAERRPTDTFRALPHRGDYLVRHRIDGHIDPTPCFSCHGNPRSAARCRRCHG